MDINILLALQQFRNGVGSVGFFIKNDILRRMPYPMGYDAEGKLLVDGAKMANDTYKAVGLSIAFLIGWILERRYIGFTTEVPLMRKLTRGVIGLICYYAVSLILAPLIITRIPPPPAGTIISSFVPMFYVSFVFPWCMKRPEKEKFLAP